MKFSTYSYSIILFLVVKCALEQQKSVADGADESFRGGEQPPLAGCKMPSPPQYGTYSSPQCQQGSTLPQCHSSALLAPPYWLLAFSCHEGFQLPRKASVYFTRCFDGIWAPVPPVCLDDRITNYILQSSLPKSPNNLIPGGCLLPKYPPNGRYYAFACTNKKQQDPACQYKPGTPVPPAWTLTYTCDPGFVQQSSVGGAITQYARCNNGSWDVSPPICIKTCPGLVSKNQDFRCFNGDKELNCSKPVMPGTIATYQCHKFFSRDPRDTAKFISCTAEGQWTYQPPPCKPTCGLSNIDSAHPRIIDGDPSPLGHFPWHTGVYHRSAEGNGWDQFCGGSLITPNVVLTAAYCVVKEGQDRTGTKMRPQDVGVALGKYYRDWNNAEPTQVKREVLEVAVPANYRGSSTSFESDIALLLLKEDMPLSSVVTPVCLEPPVGLQPSSNMLGYITGWGNSEMLRPSDTVLYCSWPYQDYNACFQNMVQKKDGYISADKFCAGVEVRAAARKSIGGGFSFVFNNRHYIYGLLSSQVVRRDEIDYLKDFNYPVFTNVTHLTHTQWIRENLNRWSNTGDDDSTIKFEDRLTFT